MKRLYSLLFIISAGFGFGLPLPSAYSQLSISGSHDDRSQTHWTGVGNDLIDVASPALLSVTPEPSGQQGAITMGIQQLRQVARLCTMMWRANP